METLPLKLSNAIDRELAPLSPEKLREACSDLSQRYAQGLFMETELHRQAYIAARLPATYGVVRQVFNHVEPFLSPIQSVLDLGAGVGSLAWAAAEAMPNLQRVTLFEKNIELLRLGQHLTQNHLDPLQLAWCRGNIGEEQVFPSHDAVVASYVLNELSPQEQTHVLTRAYHATENMLILIEPGTPKGFGNLLQARNHLLKLGAHTLAPCPHDRDCPLTASFNEGKDWCHFSARIPRGKYHKQAKDGTLPYEDEKYAYLVASPHPPALSKDRIIKAPMKKSGHVILDLCTEKDGLKRLVVSKRNNETYKSAKDARWGDEWER